MGFTLQNAAIPYIRVRLRAASMDFHAAESPAGRRGFLRVSDYTNFTAVP